MDFLKRLLANVGLLTGDGSDAACPFLWIDEPEAPESLIK